MKQSSILANLVANALGLTLWACFFCPSLMAQDIKALLRQAFDAEKARDYDKAIAICTDLISRNPKLAPAYTARSFAYKQNGDFDKAIVDLNKAVRLDPKAVNYVYRGIAYNGRGAATLSLTDQDKAIADYTEAIRLDPKSAQAYYDRGNAFSDKAALTESEVTFDKAIADFNAALQLRPRYAYAHGGRGGAYLRKGELDKAVADLNEAIQLDPMFSQAYDNLGTCYMCQGEYAKANAQFSKSIQLSPNAVYSYLNRGMAYIYTGDYDKAIIDFSNAIRLAQKNALWSARAYRGRGLVYARKGDYGKAQSDFNNAIHTGSKDCYVYNSIAWFLATCPEARFRDGRRAIEYAVDASKLAKRTDSYPLDTLAAAYAEAGDFEQAMKSEERFLQFPNLSADRRADAKVRLMLYQSHTSYRDDKNTLLAPECGPVGTSSSVR
jgi:tetratricopeptide (TPR) repeat protein